MIYTFRQKVIDNILVLTLVFSTGGLLFVYNRNTASIFLFVLLVCILSFFGKKIKRNFFNASLIAFVSISVLFIINYLFAISEQSINKYAFYFLTLSISLLVVLHFNNNRNEQQLLDRLYFVLKIIMLQALLSFFAFFVIKGSLITISATYHECETFHYLFYYTTERNIFDIFN